MFKKFNAGPVSKASILAAVILAVYLFSICPTVYLIDSGELAAVSYTLGISHPTGYPLYTIISYFFAHLPGEPIRNLNLLSALFSVAASVFVYFLSRAVLKNDLIPLLLSSLYAFAPTIWRVSITNEVYPLTALFCVLIIFLLYKMDTTRSFYLIFFISGLSLTNHMMVFSVVIPTLGYVIVVHRPALRHVIIGFLFAALGASLYFYLVVRTQAGAELAWGNAVNLQRLYWHVTGRQYQVWMFSLTRAELINNILQGSGFMLRSLLYIFILPLVLGSYWLLKHDKKKFWLFAAIFLVNFLYTINYSIPDIEPYYIPGLVALLAMAAYGFRIIGKKVPWFIVIPAALSVPLVNYKECSLRDNRFGLDYGNAHISALPPQSMLICDYWDIYSPVIYLRKVKNIRSDLVVIDKELLRRTWYIKYLKREYPEFYAKVKNEVDDFLVELYKFEYGRPYSVQQIQTKFIRMLESFVEAKIGDGVYLALPIPDQDLNQTKPLYFRIPAGLCLRIARDTSYVPFDLSGLQIEKPPIVNDKRLKYNIEFTKRTAGNHVAYLNAVGRNAEARQAQDWLNKFLHVRSTKF